MDLTVRKGYWIKVCMKLITMIPHDNYYSQFYDPFCKLVHAVTVDNYKQGDQYKHSQHPPSPNHTDPTTQTIPNQKHTETSIKPYKILTTIHQYYIYKTSHHQIEGFLMF
jgi:hypothetical protein